MDRDTPVLITEAQWVEHSDDWRLAHLDLAPSAALRRQAIEDHELRERMLAAAQAAAAAPRRGWAALPLLTRQAIVASIVVATIVIGAFVR